ncbi:hypothetical protein GTI95_18585 [Citrobacter werkmanii]|uniref:hypothetical protein n=1 Tax=Citrobacter werkmanii TaxID=67827 RepID=UPI0013696269|nr:hypothetical protein [Citrobacter werkmanii]MYL94385.1 hypothetical protein [Citrobacter werkmanii]
MMNPVPWLQMTNMISYQGLVRTFPKPDEQLKAEFDKVNLDHSVRVAKCAQLVAGNAARADDADINYLN